MLERSTHGLKTEAEAADLLGCKPWRLKYLREIGLLPYQRLGKALVVYSEVELKIAKLLLEKKDNTNG